MMMDTEYGAMRRILARRAFTLVEVLVGAAVFSVVAIAAYNAYIGLFQLINASQNKIMALNLANEQFEIARNMPYADVGIIGGIPKGKLAHIQTVSRGGVAFTVTTTVRNLDLPFDGTIGGTPNDLSPADNRLVDITVSCDTCRNFRPVSLTGQVAPKNLETASSNGALFIRVFDANGQPVQGASVHVVNVATTTTIVIDDVTDANGMLQLVDVPPGANAYRIEVTKDGYSTDRTYSTNDPSNPSPLKPDATVLLQQVTQVSFAIDRLSTVIIDSVGPTCSSIPNFGFALVGSKLIGANTPKFSQNMTTDGSGSLILSNNMEWDTYTVIPTGTIYDVAGLNPLNPTTVNAGAEQHMQLIAVPRQERSVLVTVKDSATQLPISGATVTLSGMTYSNTKTTGKGFINQTDWSGGGGQATSSDVTRYWNDDGHIDTSVPGIISLHATFGEYDQTGMLESSTFDTGSVSNFYTLTWSPVDQPVSAGNESVRFHIATATTTSPSAWNFVGPDGTASSYYTIPDAPISLIHNGDRYLRYRAYLSSISTTSTPTLTDAAFTFTSSCTPPGQVLFSGLASGSYHVRVTKEGYIDYEYDISANTAWQEVSAVMTQ